jgi:hypothetical protein
MTETAAAAVAVVQVLLLATLLFLKYVDTIALDVRGCCCGGCGCNCDSDCDSGSDMGRLLDFSEIDADNPALTLESEQAKDAESLLVLTVLPLLLLLMLLLLRLLLDPLSLRTKRSIIPIEQLLERVILLPYFFTVTAVAVLIALSDDNEELLLLRTAGGILSGRWNGCKVFGSTSPSAIPHASSGGICAPRNSNPSPIGTPAAGWLEVAVEYHRSLRQSGRLFGSTGSKWQTYEYICI